VKVASCTYHLIVGIVSLMIKAQTKAGLPPQAKLAELIKACILYGADEKDGKITKTKLAKLVYLSDFAYFYHNLEPITGVEYKKLDRGPVSLDYFDQLIDLVGTSQIQFQKKGNAELFSLTENIQEPNLGKEELELVQKVCAKWKNKKTAEVVKFTHEQLPWKISFENDAIPYSLIVQQDEATLY
jgi:uncharacterized phage-associated protein